MNYDEIYNLYDDKKDVINKDPFFCDECKEEKLKTEYNTLVCPICGVTEYYYNSLDRPGPIIFYKRMTHFMNNIKIINGDIIPKLNEEIINKIKKTNIKDIDKLLKEYKIINYKSYILNNYYNEEKIKINLVIMKQLIYKFKIFEKKFNNYNKLDNRKNFINYPLLIKIFLEELGYIELSNKIKINKLENTIIKHTNIYNKINNS